MREGPLAELFRATEAAQRRGDPPPSDADPADAPSEAAAAKPLVAAVPDTENARTRKPKSEPDPQPEPAADPHDEPVPAPGRSATAWLDPLPDHPARLERGRDSASYLAVIRVVGVGGAGLNALDRMLDAGITQVD